MFPFLYNRYQIDRHASYKAWMNGYKYIYLKHTAVFRKSLLLSWRSPIWINSRGH
jgi:hypothetical protein